MSITKTMFQERVSRMEKIMRENKLPITPQKRAIFEVLANTDKHPTAEEIHIMVKKTFSNISFATVYKNLRRFLDLGLAQEIKTKRGVSHFDADISTHAHLVKIKTKKMIDVEMLGKIPFPKGIDPTCIKQISLVYYY